MLYQLEPTGSFPEYVPPDPQDFISRVDSHISEQVDQVQIHLNPKS
jgi:hypothetical protein